MVVHDWYKEYHYSWLRSSQIANCVENSSTGSRDLKIRNRESPWVIPFKTRGWDPRRAGVSSVYWATDTSFFQKECFPFSLQSSFSYPKNGSLGVNDLKNTIKLGRRTEACEINRWKGEMKMSQKAIIKLDTLPVLWRIITTRVQSLTCGRS